MESKPSFRFDISIHAAREGGDTPRIRDGLIAMISIHAAREGGDLLTPAMRVTARRFQSTPPVKAATSDSQFWVKRDTFQSTPPVKAATSVEALH